MTEGKKMSKCYHKLKLYVDSRMDEEHFFKSIFILALLQHNNRNIKKIIKNNFIKYCKKILNETDIYKIYKETKESLFKDGVINEDGELVLCAPYENFDNLTDYEIYDLIEFCEEKIEQYLKERSIVAA